MNRIFPEILNEIQGFAEGSRAKYEDVLGFMLTVGVSPGPKCRVFMATVTGRKAGCSSLKSIFPQEVVTRTFY